MANPGKGRGCVFYGCVTIVFVTVLGVVALYFISTFALKKYLVEPYTSTNAIAVAPVRLPPALGEEAMKRVDQFRASIQAGTNSSPLALTADELDYVSRMSPDGKDIKDRAALTITNGLIRAQVSLPLDAFQVKMFRGRYLNGSASFGLSLTNGGIVVDLKAMDVNGQDLPEQALAQMRAQGLAWYPEPTDKAAAVVTNLERIEIKEDKLLLHPKKKQ